MSKIGITERGDAAFNDKWIKWVKSGNPAVLITKQPNILVNKLISNDLLDSNIIIHVCITGNGDTVIEPNVPKYQDSLDDFYYLVDKYGKDRVVLRIDPIIPTEPFLQNSYAVLDAAKTKLGDDLPRVRISFLDNYNHVKERMKELGLETFDYYFHAPLSTRIKIWNDMGRPELCGEEGMTSTSCISEIDCKIFGVEPIKAEHSQRKECGCLGNKHELLNTPKPCNSKCVYCYWKNK